MWKRSEPAVITVIGASPVGARLKCHSSRLEMTLPGGYRVNLGPAGGNGRIFVASAVVLTWTRDGDLKFGTGLFLKEEKDRNGLAARYPGLFLIPRARARADRQLNNFNLLPAGGQANRLFPAAKAGSESPLSRQFPAAKRPPEAHSWRASR